MTRRAFNRRYDFIGVLTQGPHEKPAPSYERWLDMRRPRRPYVPIIRPSHLKARKRFPTHPLVKIAKVLPVRLPTMAELEAMTHEELARRFLKTSRKFKCHPKSV